MVFDVCGGLPMVIQGGVFDLVRDLPTLLELCGAKIISGNGKKTVQFEQLGEDEPPKGLIRYGELKASGLLGLPTSEHSANAAVVGGLKFFTEEEEPGYHGGTAGSERVRDEVTMINSLSQHRGARSSDEPLAPTRPAIDVRGEGVKILASDLARDLVLAAQDGLNSEQNSPRSDNNMCATCFKPKIVSHDSIKVERCMCDSDEVIDEDDVPLSELVEK